MLAPWCERESADQAVVDLGAGALDWWADHGAGYRRTGTLVVAPGRDRADLARFARRTTSFETIGAERIAELEPDLAGRFHEALFFATSASIIYSYVQLRHASVINYKKRSNLIEFI